MPPACHNGRASWAGGCGPLPDPGARLLAALPLTLTLACGCRLVPAAKEQMCPPFDPCACSTAPGVPPRAAGLRPLPAGRGGRHTCAECGREHGGRLRNGRGAQGRVGHAAPARGGAGGAGSAGPTVPRGRCSACLMVMREAIVRLEAVAEFFIFDSRSDARDVRNGFLASLKLGMERTCAAVALRRGHLGTCTGGAVGRRQFCNGSKFGASICHEQDVGASAEWLNGPCCSRAEG